MSLADQLIRPSLKLTPTPDQPLTASSSGGSIDPPFIEATTASVMPATTRKRLADQLIRPSLKQRRGGLDDDGLRRLADQLIRPSLKPGSPSFVETAPVGLADQLIRPSLKRWLGLGGGTAAGRSGGSIDPPFIEAGIDAHFSAVGFASGGSIDPPFIEARMCAWPHCEPQCLADQLIRPSLKRDGLRADRLCAGGVWRIN